MSNEVVHDCSFLTDIISEGSVEFSDASREQYSADASPHPASFPDAVVWPETAEEASQVVSAANDRAIPIIPWGGGSGLEGNAIPKHGGIVLNMTNFTAVNIRPRDLQVDVGPGVNYDDLNEQLSAQGLWFPPGISSGNLATIGGMIATNASGFNSVRYGETRDHILRLEVILPDGQVIECGRNVIKTSSGYSLKDLFIGSEGTLGVITNATIALTGIPEFKHGAIVPFPSATHASRAVSDIIGTGLLPGAIEFVNDTALELINAYSDTDFTEIPTLFIELHANNTGIEEDVDLTKQICDEHNSENWIAAPPESMNELWEARRNAYDATRAYRADWEVAVVGDIVVPISRYPEIVTRIETLSTDLDLVCPTLGHAGDGNLHYAPLVDPTDDEMVARAHELNESIVSAALELGGSATGEHGIGSGKRQFMTEEHGEALALMQTIKHAIDPNEIMNPGKILPSTIPDT